MEPASIALAIPGLMDGCMKTYQLVSTMIGPDASLLQVIYRAKEGRLRVWAKIWGLTDVDDTSSQLDLRASESKHLSDGRLMTMWD